MAPTADFRIEGVLESWDDDRGFGFLALPYGGKPVFVHIRAFDRGAGRPEVGDRFSFLVEQVEGDKFRAIQLRSLNKAPQKSPSRPRPREKRAASRPTSAAWLAPLAFVGLYIALDLQWGIPFWVAGAYAALSAVSFGQYAADKRAAQQNRWRIPESNLHLVSALGGWPGSIAAQQVLRHKTRKASFLRTFWGIAMLNVIVFVGAVAVLRGNVVETLGL